jgi:hypothetical protein
MEKSSLLYRVIDADTTKRLLIDLGARGYETPREYNEEVLGLILKHPLARIE